MCGEQSAVLVGSGVLLKTSWKWFLTLWIAPCRLPECAMSLLQLVVGLCVALRKAIAEVSPEEAEACSAESH